MATPNSQTAYDRVPYVGYSFQQTHPNRLATAARLFGLAPAPVENCRVLELGCGDGGNLIPMAYALSASCFVGLDLAAEAVRRGQAVIDDLELKNIELRAQDLMDVDDDLGEFDYVIAHGVYSWIPAPVRDRLLELCRRHLAPQGVAFVSYNTFPGWHLWRAGRDMMRFHTRDMADPEERVAQGLALLKFILLNYQGEGHEQELFGHMLREHLDKLEEYRHYEHVFHDDLAEINEPVYFYQFAQHAARHGLQFLAEADLFEMQSHGYPEPIRRMLAQFPDEQIILKEQYLDFLKGRAFRQTLLCRAELKLKREIEARQLKNFYLTALTHAASAEPDLRAGVVETFEGMRGGRLQTDFPLAKAALVELQQARPQPLKFDELLRRARRRLDVAGVAEASGEEAEAERVEVLTEILFAACRSGLARLRGHAPHVVTTVGARPTAYPLARYQARNSNVVSNVLHEKVEIDDAVGLKLLRLLDGTRDRAALVESLTAYARREKLFSAAEGNNELSFDEVREEVERKIDAGLQKLARLGLLVG